MNKNCKKSCVCGKREEDVKYIKKLIKKEDGIRQRIKTEKMAPVPAKNKLQIQVTYCVITNIKYIIRLK